MDIQESGTYFNDLYDAMLAAFPKYDEYKIFLRLYFHTPLNHITGSEKMGVVHFDVLEWFENNGRLIDLAKKAAEKRPGNQKLGELSKDSLPPESEITELDEIKIGDYSVECIMAHGDVSVVYRAIDNLNRPVVIKVLNHLFLTNVVWRERFSREAKILGKLRHQAIVPIYTYGEYKSEPYMVMPLLAGGSLSKKINKPLSLVNAVNLFQRIGPAVDYIHRQGIVHQKIKPENILFDEEGMSYLSDFGMAHLVGTILQSDQTHNPPYMSPEQFNEHRVPDPLMDVYALGVMLYEILTGKLPFQANSWEEFYSLHTNMPVPNILEEKPDYPAGLQPLIGKAMAKDPAMRFASATDLTKALQELLTV